MQESSEHSFGNECRYDNNKIANREIYGKSSVNNVVSITRQHHQFSD